MVENPLRRQGGPDSSAPHRSAPIRCGRFPALPDACSPRPETGLGLVASAAADYRPAGPGGLSGQATRMIVLAGPSGCGKSTLAVAMADGVARSGGAELIVWVNGASRADVLIGYAEVLRDTSMTDLLAQPEAAATRMLAWLAQTERTWLMVLDDVSDPAALRGLWPSGPAGQLVVTCRQSADLTEFSELGARICEIGPFSPREALSYLATRLNEDPDQRVEALDLAGDLGCQPLPLGLATATMTGTMLSCRDYRQRFSGRKQELLGRIAPDQVTPVEVAWALALDRADQRPPAGLARSLLALLTLLDPAGVPLQVLTTRVVCSGVTVAGSDPVATESQIRAALGNLALVGLAEIDQSGGRVQIRLHPLVQTAGARLVPAKVLEAAALVAADALLEAWPRVAADPVLSQALRDCAISLHEKAGQVLWAPDPHPVLRQIGTSLADSGLAHHALSYWQSLLSSSARTLGGEHEQTLNLRDQLAAACVAAGQLADAIELYSASVAAREQISGPEHPDTLTVRASLAGAYRSAGTLDAAIDGYARVLAGREWALGSDSPETLSTRSQLAATYHQSGRLSEAVTLYRRNIVDWERTAGPEHLETLTESLNLGRALQASGDYDEAIKIFRRVRAIREKALGAEHPETLNAVASLAYVYRTADRMKEAIPCYRQTLAGRERALGPDHPDTLIALANLASCYHSAQKLKDAVPLYERVLADRERIQGHDHPDVLTARGNLANAYHSAGRLVEAVPVYEQTVAGFDRTLGSDHPDTLTSRGNLAHAYYAARRHHDAIAVFKRTLSDCERALGPDHELTVTIRDNLRAITR